MSDNKQNYFPTQVEEYSPNPSPSKTEADLRREKKKKSTAFKTFLNQIQSSPLDDYLPKRKLSDETVNQQKLPTSSLCKICERYMGDKTKLCEFCNEIVCSSHIRKKRRNPQINKFNRICDFCQDKYLFQKNLKLQMKAEQSLITQELIIQARSQQIKEVKQSKKIKMQVLINHKREMEQNKKKQLTRLQNLQNQLERKTLKLEYGTLENQKLEIQLKTLQEVLPPSLEDDYNFLLEQNARITKDLVKFQKLCKQAIKARSQKQKDMYEQYYQWQQLQKNKLQGAKKDQQCSIY